MKKWGARGSLHIGLVATGRARKPVLKPAPTQGPSATPAILMAAPTLLHPPKLVLELEDMDANNMLFFYETVSIYLLCN